MEIVTVLQGIVSVGAGVVFLTTSNLLIFLGDSIADLPLDELKDMKDQILDQFRENLEEVDVDITEKYIEIPQHEIENNLDSSIQIIIQERIEDVNSPEYENAFKSLYNIITDKEIDSVVDDVTEKIKENAEYRKDPWGYHGLRQSDFY